MNQATSIVSGLARLVSDTDFRRLGELAHGPNFFRVVGRTFTETWHSSFMGWLLDPQGSHGLGDFPLRRLLTAVATSQNACQPDLVEGGLLSPAQLATYAATTDFIREGEAGVLPNERNTVEFDVPGVGRLDVWVDFKRDEEDGGPDTGLKCIIEMKVEASLSRGQAGKYSDWLRGLLAASGSKGVLIFIAPDIGETSRETTFSPHYYCLDFQLYHDEVLRPCIEHPGLSREMALFMLHYIRNMRAARKTGRRLAVTEEEKQMALAIFKEHKGTFLLLADLLQSAGIAISEEGARAVQVIGEKASGGASEQVPLAVTLKDGTVVSGTVVPEFFRNAFAEIERRGRMSAIGIPVDLGGRSQYFASATKQHKDGSSYFNPIPYPERSNPKFYIEGNISRSGAVGKVSKLMKMAGLSE